MLVAFELETWGGRVEGGVGGRGHCFGGIFGGKMVWRMRFGVVE